MLVVLLILLSNSLSARDRHINFTVLKSALRSSLMDSLVNTAKASTTFAHSAKSMTVGL